MIIQNQSNLIVKINNIIILPSNIILGRKSQRNWFLKTTCGMNHLSVNFFITFFLCLMTCSRHPTWFYNLTCVVPMPKQIFICFLKYFLLFAILKSFDFKYFSHQISDSKNDLWLMVQRNFGTKCFLPSEINIFAQLQNLFKLHCNLVNWFPSLIYKIGSFYYLFCIYRERFIRLLHMEFKQLVLLFAHITTKWAKRIWYSTKIDFWNVATPRCESHI